MTVNYPGWKSLHPRSLTPSGLRIVAFGIALYIRNVLNSFLTKQLFLVVAVRTPEAAIEDCANLLQVSCQGDFCFTGFSGNGVSLW